MSHHFRILIPALVALAACAGDPGPQAVADAGIPDANEDAGLPDTSDAVEEVFEPAPACEAAYAAPIDVGPIASDDLTEASGVVASRLDPDILWLHNDSGDTARIFAFDTDGKALGQVTLGGVEAVDFEDIAAGPCPDGSGPCLWIADIGNNGLDRTDLTLYVLPEPDVGNAPFEPRIVVPRWRLPIEYPNDQVDSEALMIDAQGTAWIFEKVDADTGRLFEHPGPYEDGESVTLEQAAVFPLPGARIALGRMVTGADLHPGGRRAVIRVYTGSFEYRLTQGQTLRDIANIEPVLVAAGPLSERQGESIGYASDGLGIWTISEGEAQPLHFYGCAEP